jgi:hypothetical protein
MEIEVKDRHYNFVYVDVESPFEPSIAQELIRSMEYINIKYKIRCAIESRGLKPKKRSLADAVGRLMTDFILYSRSGKITRMKDGFFHYADAGDANKTFAEYIADVFGSTQETAAQIAKQINILGLFDSAIHRIANTPEAKAKAYKKYDPARSKNASSGSHLLFESLGVIKHRLTIPTSVYEILKKRYSEYKAKSKHKYKLDDLVYMLLLRYNTFDSGGNQWGMPYAIREKFRKELGFNFECFASALNHYYYYYCSAFYDIEKYFMSLGPFQNITYIRGTYMANPPYEMHLLNSMVDMFERALAANKSLVFMYGLPDWELYGDRVYFLDKSRESRYHKYHIKYDPYVWPWHDFMSHIVIKIPASYRFVLANVNVDVARVKKIIYEWRDLHARS